MKNILITYAVKEEFIPLKIGGYEVSYLQTGIGKVRSAMKLTEVIFVRFPDLVINIGTAGTLSHSVGDVFLCQKFVDRDYESVEIPGVVSEIDFTTILKSKKVVKNWLSKDIKIGICNTGDSFVTRAGSINGDIVDMEAFAQAMVCKEYRVPFVSVKYVTDIIGQNSVKHWEDKLTDARKGLTEWFDKNQ